MIFLKDLKQEGYHINSLRLEEDNNCLWQGDSSFIKSIFEKICLLQRDTSMIVHWKNHDINFLSEKEEAAFRKDVTLVFDWGGLLSNQTLESNLLLPLHYHQYDVVNIQKEIHKIFHDMSYQKYLHLRPSEVPFHLKKFTTILRGLILNTKYIFIEDFSCGLENRDLIFFKEYIQSLKISLHCYDSLGKFCVEDADVISMDTYLRNSA